MLKPYLHLMKNIPTTNIVQFSFDNCHRTINLKKNQKNISWRKSDQIIRAVLPRDSPYLLGWRCSTKLIFYALKID